jgi:hypothetical protein
MSKNFEYYFYDLFTNPKTKEEIMKIIWEPLGFEAIQKSYKEIEWNISDDELLQIKSDYKKYLSKIYDKNYHFKSTSFGLSKSIKDALLVRYQLIGALNNVSLSVPQETKLRLMKLGLKHEMFGSFFNTQFLLSYCCLFPDLEAPRCTSDFFNFKPKKHSEIQEINGYLVNPPYDKLHIKTSSQKVLEWLKGSSNLRFFVILPVWDVKFRTSFNLPLYSDLPEINELIDSKYTVFHRIFKGKEFPFYSGITNKLVNLKDPIHVIILQSSNLPWNKNIENLFLNLIKIQ